MKTLIAALLGLSNLAQAEEIHQDIALVHFTDEEEYAVDHGLASKNDILDSKSSSEITYLPTPLSATNLEAEKAPGKWTDEQMLTLETFTEIVAADIENVWVVAYIDPRCRDCLILSVEWEKLTQIEEREKRKIKLGYVDISVEENWKIIQDHTKGKKMTQTPAVTLYGENKETPYWYPEETPDAKGVHTWASSYADHFGYGHWNPNEYSGSGVNGYAYDKSYSPQYRTNGKYIQGNQVIQLSKDKNGAVMRRRTVATGGKLSGALHEPTKGYGNKHQGYGSTSPSYGSQNQHQPQGGSRYGGNYQQSSDSGRYGSYGGNQASTRNYGGYGQQASRYGGQQQHASRYGGQQQPTSRYGGQQQPTSRYGKSASRYGQQASRYGGQQQQPSRYGGYGQKSQYGGYGNNQYGNNGSYGSNSSYGGQYGSQASKNQYGSYGGRGYGQGHFNGQGHGNKLGTYTSQYQPPTPYNKGSQQPGYGTKDSYNNKNRVGSYGNPYQSYQGPGVQHLSQKPYDGYGSARYHEVLGKGVVLGKYSYTDGATYEVTDFNEEIIAGPDDKAYKEALAIAKNSGNGSTDINWGYDNYVDMDHVRTQEDIPDTYALKAQIDATNADKEKSGESREPFLNLSHQEYGENELVGDEFDF